VIPDDLAADVERAIYPMRLIVHDGVADLVHRDGGSPVLNYSDGPSDVLALVSAEQRYLVEQGGADKAVPGTTYLDKARERLRRWDQRTG
jgi:hypothetical protein